MKVKVFALQPSFKAKRQKKAGEREIDKEKERERMREKEREKEREIEREGGERKQRGIHEAIKQ